MDLQDAFKDSQNIIWMDLGIVPGVIEGDPVELRSIITYIDRN